MICIKNLLKEFEQAQTAEAEILLAHVLKKDRTFVIAHGEEEIDEKKKQHFLNLMKRRQRGEPLAYLLGHQPFFGLEFIVNRHVLIPRPESEWLVEKAIEILQDEPKINPVRNSGSVFKSPPGLCRGGNLHRQRQGIISNGIKTVIDIGTGSGCLIISLLKNLSIARRQGLTAYATDISFEALKVARRNAKLHKITKIKFRRGNLLSPASCLLPMLRSASQGEQAASSPILLLANLPYLTTQDYRETSPSVRRYEPKQALWAGRDGLKFYRALVTSMTKYPNNVFYCLWEIDPCHSQKLVNLIKEHFPSPLIRIKKDPLRHDRYVSMIIQSKR